MKTIKIKSLFTLLLIISLQSFGQDNNDAPTSNIQTFTPSKLINKGQWDIKFFNGLYTQDRRTDAGSTAVDIPRENFFTSTLEVFTGVSENNRISLGAIFEFRSNTWSRNNDSNGFGIDPDWSGTTRDPLNRGWHFIVGVKDNNIAKLFLDGTVSNQESESSNFSGSGIWKIGRRAYSTSSAFGGKISQVFIYNAPLTNSEVSQLYAATNRY